MSFKVVVLQVTPRPELPPLLLNLLKGLLGLMKFRGLLHDIPDIPRQRRLRHEILGLRVKPFELLLDVTRLEMSFAFGTDSFEAGGEGGYGAGFCGLLRLRWKGFGAFRI